MYFVVLEEIGPFIFMYAIFTIVFTLFSIILMSEVSDGESECPGVHPFVRMFFQTLRISVGDL